MALAFIGLGSNIGDGRKNLRSAWQALTAAKQVTTLGLSRPYLSAPVGMESAQWFTNAVGAIDTSLAPEELLELLLSIEQKMGRDRRKGDDRIVDLDILYFNDKVQNSGNLIIPHPEMHKRLFVLAPLEELAPDKIHPLEKISTTAMRQKLLAVSAQPIKCLTWSEDI
jgi:2-amino-4-hydroxy-6-hydroxymethyldihydropteridine diphosphokinase